MILWIIRGLPGSGKSTYAKSIGCFHIENDMMKISDGQYKGLSRRTAAKQDVLFLTEYVLSKGLDVAVSNVFYNLKSMEPFFALAKKYGAKVRVRHMCNKFKNIHDVPEFAVQGFKNKWEPYEGEVEIKD